jgi:hypothetical protein
MQVLRWLAKACDEIAPLPGSRAASIAPMSRRRFGALAAGAFGLVVASPNRAIGGPLEICDDCDGAECPEGCTPGGGSPCPGGGMWELPQNCWCGRGGCHNGEILVCPPDPCPEDPEENDYYLCCDCSCEEDCYCFDGPYQGFAACVGA